MKIMSVIDAISGGGAMVMFNLIKGLPQHQHVIAVPSAWDTRQIGLPQMIKESNIPVRYINAVRENGVAKGLEDLVLRENPDIIINHWWRSSRIQRMNKFGRTRKHYGRAQIVLVSHNNDVSPPGYDMYISVSKCNSNFQKHANKERKGGKVNHRVIYNGIDIEKFNVPRQPIPGKFVIGRISALPKFKAPQDMIYFLNTFNVPNALFKIIGEGERRGHFIRDVRRLSAKDKFDLPGEIPNQQIPDALAQFDMLLYITEKDEAFSLALLEAMAAGLPIVTQNMGGNSEQVIHGKTGFLANSRRELKGYCELLAKNPQLCKEMGVAAKERAQYFTIKRMCEEYDQLFKELTNG